MEQDPTAVAVAERDAVVAADEEEQAAEDKVPAEKEQVHRDIVFAPNAEREFHIRQEYPACIRNVLNAVPQ